LTSINVAGGDQTTLAYDNADELQTYTVTNGGAQVQRYTYTFDGAGSRIGRTDQANSSLSYVFDQAFRMTSYGSSTAYAYNGDGLRIVEERWCNRHR
jgi:YD repeat-containing protein